MLGWGRGIFHCLGLLALPDAFVWGKVAAPACPAGRTGTFSKQLFMLDQAGLCCQSPCPAPRQGPLGGQHFLLISCILGSSRHVCSLEGGESALRVLRSPVLLLGSVCMEGGWGFGVGCTFNNSLSQFWLGTLLENSCSHARIRAEEVAVVKMPDLCLASPCHLC